MTEDLVDGIADGFDGGALPERYKLAIRLTDVIIHDPTGMSDDLRRDLAREFSPAEIVELAMTITMAMGFSKMAISWGPPPSMPLTEVPTPAPDTTVA